MTCQKSTAYCCYMWGLSLCTIGILLTMYTSYSLMSDGKCTVVLSSNLQEQHEYLKLFIRREFHILMKSRTYSKSIADDDRINTSKQPRKKTNNIRVKPVDNYTTEKSKEPVRMTTYMKASNPITSRAFKLVTNYQNCNWSTFEGKEYLVIPEETDCNVAEQACVELGGNLASIRFREQNNYIKRETLKAGLLAVRVGGRREGESRTFTWPDGNNTNHFNDWRSGEPNNIDYKEWSMEVNIGGWNDASCERSKNYYICIKQGDHCDRRQWQTVKGNRCVRLSKSKLTWTLANIFCQEFGANLPGQTDEDLAIHLSENKNKKTEAVTWLNAKRIGFKWYWMKDDKEQEMFDIKSKRWQKGEPNDRGNQGHTEDCLEMTTASGWNDITCDSVTPPPGFVCERQKL